MALRRRSRSGFRRSAKAPTLWFNNQSAVATLAAAGTGVFELSPETAIPTQLRGGYTCLRMIGALNVFPVTGNAAVSFTHGVTVITTSALTGPQLPDPAVDLVDWYLLQGEYLRDEVDQTVHRYPFDIRTARKVRGLDRTIVYLLKNTSGASSIEYSVFTRLLLRAS